MTEPEVAELTALRTELDHAQSALTGSHDGMRLWMADCSRVAERNLGQRKAADARWQALRDYLDDRIAALKAEAVDWAPVSQMTREFEGKTATLVSVRKRMDELEAQK